MHCGSLISISSISSYMFCFFLFFYKELEAENGSKNMSANLKSKIVSAIEHEKFAHIQIQYS